jgi:hypothetical protein
MMHLDGPKIQTRYDLARLAASRPILGPGSMAIAILEVFTRGPRSQGSLSPTRAHQHRRWSHGRSHCSGAI